MHCAAVSISLCSGVQLILLHDDTRTSPFLGVTLDYICWIKCRINVQSISTLTGCMNQASFASCHRSALAEFPYLLAQWLETV